MKIGFFELLTLIFITLKLTGVITWSWLLVLSPIPVGFLITLLVVNIYVLVSHLND